MGAPLDQSLGGEMTSQWQQVSLFRLTRIDSAEELHVVYFMLHAAGYVAIATVLTAITARLCGHWICALALHADRRRLTVEHAVRCMSYVAWYTVCCMSL